MDPQSRVTGRPTTPTILLLLRVSKDLQVGSEEENQERPAISNTCILHIRHDRLYYTPWKYPYELVGEMKYPYDLVGQREKKLL